MENIRIEFLKNGIPVLMEDIKSINTVSFGVFVKTGAINEEDFESGVSHYIEHMMFKGTKTRTAKDISEEIDSIGGIINAYTGRTTTAYYTQMLSTNLEVGMEILSDMFLNSTFTQDNLDKEKKVILEEIKMYGDIPDEVIQEENILHAITGRESNRVAGTLESVEKIDRNIFLNYFKNHYIAQNIVISIAGNLDEENIIKYLDKTFGEIKKSNVKEEILEHKLNSGEKLINMESQQVHICFNTIGLGSHDPNKYALAIISNVLAGNMSSRLFQKIREERGLAYSVYSYPTPFEDFGLFTVYAGTTKENYGEVIEIIKNEFEDIKNFGIKEKELQKAKNQFLTSLTLGLENSRGKMTRMANSYLTYGKIISVDEMIDNINKITLEDIKNVAKNIFDEKYYSWTILKGE